VLQISKKIVFFSLDVSFQMMMLMVTFVFVADESCSAEAAEDEALSAEKQSVDNSCKTTVAAKKHTRKHRKRRRKAGMIRMTSCFVFCLCEFLLFSDVCMCKIVELFFEREDGDDGFVDNGDNLGIY